MNKYEINELEGFERPYEIDFSSMKSSKNDSLKVKANKLKSINNNLLDINNNYNQKYIFRNSQNINNINSFKSLPNNNPKYFRLDENTKKNLQKYIESNKNKLAKKSNQNIVKNKNQKLNKNKHNNLNVYSKVDKYWENREKKNKIKMQQIKKEREQKIYGELYPKPKISKNTKEIIQRLKERNYELTEEDEYEEEINNNIPVKTKEKNYFFKTMYYSNKIKLNKKNKNKMKENKSYSKIKTKANVDFNKINQIQSTNKKRAKTPKLKRYINNNKKSSRKKKLHLSAANIKNMELINQLRQKEKDEKIKLIEEKIKEEKDENSPDKNNIRNKNDNIDNIQDNNVNNYLNKSMNIMSMRNYSINVNNISNINEIVTARKILNDIYNKDKKIINHSFVLNSFSIPKTSQFNKLDISYQTYRTSNNKISKTLDDKRYTKNKSINKSKSKDKKMKQYGLYDPLSKSLKYRHYTDISNSYIKVVNNDNNNYDDNIKDDYENESKEKVKISGQIVNPNITFQNYNQSYCKNKIKNNLFFEFDREIQEKKDEVNRIYKNEIKHRKNEIKKIEIELKERNMINNKLINESNIDDEDFQKIVSKNEYINNKFNQLDKESLLKFREENLKKLEELRQKGNKYDLNANLKNMKEEEKNIDNKINKKIYTMKYQSILGTTQQKIENNLDLYNNELKMNNQKKKALLNKIYGNDYSKNILSEEIDDSSIYNNEPQFKVDKYLVKDELDKKENFTNKYFSSIINKEKNNEDSEIIVGDFDFQRNHRF